MLGKRSRPAIGKLAGAIRSGIRDSSLSPRSPLECKMQSPRGLKNYDQGGIGLGIAVALDNSTNNGATNRGEVLAKYAICGQFSARSTPIRINNVTPKNEEIIGNNKSNNSGMFKGQMVMEGLDEEFTYVTCHGPNKSIATRVYYEGGDFGQLNQNLVGVKNSPTRLGNIQVESNSNCESDFLSSCHHLCKNTLHGKDIYMYRGEKAFCSAECRQRQIGIDERKEKCRSEVSILSSSPCTQHNRSGQIFFSTGIVAV